VDALCSHGGLPGVRVALLKNPHSSDIKDKMKGISKFNNFEFSEKGVRTWRAYAIGEGKLFPLADDDGKQLCSFQFQSILSSGQTDDL